MTRTFTNEQCDALFAAILIDDEVDRETELPATIRFDYARRDLIDCFGLAHRLWETGFDRDFLVHAAATLLRDGNLDAADWMTARELHAARKIIGRQVSFYDTLRTLHPSPDSDRMSRSLSAINGLMGSLHDELVVTRTRDRSTYDEVRFALPDPIRTRLAALVDRIGV